MRFSLPLLILSTACTQATAGQSPAEETSFRAVSLLKMDEGVEMVQAHCGACHSLALVTQNRMTREGWIGTIRWMQEKQGLWDLGEAETIIVDYLERNYGVADVPWRRKPLEE